MWRIAQSHSNKKMWAFLLQEHHLTKAKAKDKNVYQIAKQHNLLYIQSDMPNSDVKGGTAIVIHVFSKHAYVKTHKS